MANRSLRAVGVQPTARQLVSGEMNGLRKFVIAMYFGTATNQPATPSGPVK